MFCALLLLTLVFTADASLDDDLEGILKSPSLSVQAFQSYLESTNQHFPDIKEARERLKIWKNTAKRVAGENKHYEKAHYTALNKFADKTAAEKRQHLGFNFTANYKPVTNTAVLEKREVPDVKMWLDGVAPVIDQGDCRSC